MTALLAALLPLPVLGADAPSKTSRPVIYDEKADGGKQIAEALNVAKKEHKRVLLQFGANWCGWCHRLHKLFQSDEKIAAQLKESWEYRSDFLGTSLAVGQSLSLGDRGAVE